MGDITIADLEARLDALNFKVCRSAEILVHTWRNGRSDEAVSRCEAVLEEFVDRMCLRKSLLGRARNGAVDLQDVERLP